MTAPPGCIAAADTIEETETLISEVMAFHIEEVRKAGLDAPKPTSIAKEITPVLRLDPTSDDPMKPLDCRSAANSSRVPAKK